MAGDLGAKLGGMFRGIKKAAEDALETQQVAVARGKSAAHAVRTDAGEPIVEPGQTIDDAIIETAKRHGKLAALAASAVASQAQDFREKMRDAYNATPEGQEKHAFATSEDYIEARQFIGWKAAVDVTDIRGNVIIAAGSEISDEDVRRARDANLLAALVYSARQSPPPGPVVRPQAPPAQPATPSTAHRTARPLACYYDEDEEQKPE